MNNRSTNTLLIPVILAVFGFSGADPVFAGCGDGGGGGGGGGGCRDIPSDPVNPIDRPGIDCEFEEDNGPVPGGTLIGWCFSFDAICWFCPDGGGDGSPFCDGVASMFIPNPMRGLPGIGIPSRFRGVGPSQKQGPVHLGTGSAFVNTTDFRLRINGADWFHRRTYASVNMPTEGWHGEGWWSNEMMNVSVAVNDGTSDVTLEYDPYHSYVFSYSSGSWTAPDNYPMELTFDAGNDEYLVRRVDGYTWVFHDKNATKGALINNMNDFLLGFLSEGR